jgi:signal transduction histidine kinase
MNTGGPFFDRDLYVFVLDLSGRLLVNGRFPELIGTSALGGVDASGNSFVGKAIGIARGPGRGWVEYQWYNPCTGEYGAKSSYIVRVGDYLVGVGAYGSVSA